MNETLRGLIVFVTVLITIGIWAPLRNRPERLPEAASAGGAMKNWEDSDWFQNWIKLARKHDEPGYPAHHPSANRF